MIVGSIPMERKLETFVDELGRNWDSISSSDRWQKRKRPSFLAELISLAEHILLHY